MNSTGEETPHISLLFFFFFLNLPSVIRGWTISCRDGGAPLPSPFLLWTLTPPPHLQQHLLFFFPSLFASKAQLTNPQFCCCDPTVSYTAAGWHLVFVCLSLPRVVTALVLGRPHVGTALQPSLKTDHRSVVLRYPWKLLIQSMKCGLVTERVKGLSVYSSSRALRV